MGAGLAPVALDEPDPLPDALRLGGQRLAHGAEHHGVGLQAGDLVARAGQPEGLGALAGADVEDAQPPADGVASAYLLVELAGDQLLPDGVP
ncbi:hypothetical protein GCM10010324_48130 [Streptomyces hiroshimensis]|uniref:Uncharacterized protein n=1 Tax=Streptomyces hiroshimensis TaxID=66424 RepID=A0ABQ2YX71_9ACTN|nr:hypothetical protein GCM10010324_48130 [Streptomyces hiroshimensis]